MILHTGLRTDIPAFYSQWFENRLREGYVLVRNPYRPGAVTRYRLSPEVVDVLCFCTKNPEPMLARWDALKPYGMCWFVTITPYGRDLEPRVPDKERVAESFCRLAERTGPAGVTWRYDPIWVGGAYPVERHLEAFDRLARRLEGATDTCVISFIDLYSKVKRNFPEARAVTREERLLLGREMATIAHARGMTLKTCAEGEELAPFGVDCRGCMTVEAIARAAHCRLHAPKTHPGRSGCACYLSADIGAYNTCGHLCRYCYANDSAEAVRRNMARHDPRSPFLIGGFLPGDRVTDARQQSWKDEQISLFDG